MKRLSIFLLRSSLPGAEESNEAGRDGISLFCISHIVVYTAYNWPARRDAGEADDFREREKPRLDDAQVGHSGSKDRLLLNNSGGKERVLLINKSGLEPLLLVLAP